MKKMVFVLLLVALLLSLALPVVALAACPGGEDPYPPGTAKNNVDHARDPIVVIPKVAAEGRAGFIPVSTPP